MELEMDCLTSMIPLQNVFSYKCHFCSKVCATKAGLSSLYDCWAKYKEKVPYVSDPNQDIDTTCNSRLKFTQLKDLFIVGCVKTSQSLKMNYVCSYVAKPNTAIPNIRIFSRRYHFRL